MAKFNQEDLEDSVKEMRRFHQEYQEKGKGSAAVRDFLEKAFNDEVILKRYLIGRKYRPKQAWETIRSCAEARLEKYPELFPATLPPKELLFCENKPVLAVLKERDSKGRRICYLKAGSWDPNKGSLEELIILGVPVAEKLFLDDDCLSNGVIFVHDCSGVGLSHAKQYAPGPILKFLNIYWYSYPLKVKGVYIVNVPSFLTYMYAILRPFLPKKLKDRIIFSKTNRKYEELHERLSQDILPHCLGGNVEDVEANDSQFL